MEPLPIRAILLQLPFLYWSIVYPLAFDTLSQFKRKVLLERPPIFNPVTAFGLIKRVMVISQ